LEIRSTGGGKNGRSNHEAVNGTGGITIGGEITRSDAVIRVITGTVTASVFHHFAYKGHGGWARPRAAGWSHGVTNVLGEKENSSRFEAGEIKGKEENVRKRQLSSGI